jgi:pimeloyl-ACP methyl ester carboxylesterase
VEQLHYAFSKKTVITIDLLGHGETESAGYFIAWRTMLMLFMLYSLNCGSGAILVGHSMGGYVAGFQNCIPKM